MKKMHIKKLNHLKAKEKENMYIINNKPNYRYVNYLQHNL